MALKCWIDIYIQTPWYNLKRGVPNLFVWFITIWKDRWWDHSFFYVLLHKKLSLMEKNFRKHGHHTNADKDADKMKICINLLDRLIKDEYEDVAMEKYDKKWGKLSINWKPFKGDLVEGIFHRDNVVNKKDKKLASKEFRNIMTMANKQKEQDINLLFLYLKRHIQTWWD